MNILYACPSPGQTLLALVLTGTQHVSGLGYLSRTVLLPRISSSEEGEADELAATTLEMEDESAAVVPGELQTCKQYVVYSPTFEVPAFYFTLNKSSACLRELTEYSLPDARIIIRWITLGPGPDCAVCTVSTQRASFVGWEHLRADPPGLQSRASLPRRPSYTRDALMVLPSVPYLRGCRGDTSGVCRDTAWRRAAAMDGGVVHGDE